MLKLTTRQVREIGFCLSYAQDWAHGAAGHNTMLLVAALAKEQGFALDSGAENNVRVPEGVTVIDDLLPRK